MLGNKLLLKNETLLWSCNNDIRNVNGRHKQTFYFISYPNSKNRRWLNIHRAKKVYILEGRKSEGIKNIHEYNNISCDRVSGTLCISL